MASRELRRDCEDSAGIAANVSVSSSAGCGSAADWPQPVRSRAVAATAAMTEPARNRGDFLGMMTSGNLCTGGRRQAAGRNRTRTLARPLKAALTARAGTFSKRGVNLGRRLFHLGNQPPPPSRDASPGAGTAHRRPSTTLPVLLGSGALHGVEGTSQDASDDRRSSHLPARGPRLHRTSTGAALASVPEQAHGLQLVLARLVDPADFPPRPQESCRLDR